MPTLTTDRATIHFRSAHPNSSSHPLLFVHGAGGHSLSWPASLRHLPGQPVFAVDLPGHGKSPAPGRAQIADYAADLAALAEAAGWPPFIVAGHSMGGAIAQQLALAYPAQVAALILIGTGARLAVNPAILTESLSDPAAVIARLQRWSWGPGNDPALVEAVGAELQANPPQILHDDYLACDRFDVRPRLGEIGQPALICCGTVDKMTPLRLSEELAAQLPDAELRTFAGAGHMLPLEQPQAIAATIAAWLAARS